MALYDVTFHLRGGQSVRFKAKQFEAQRSDDTGVITSYMIESLEEDNYNVLYFSHQDISAIESRVIEE